MTPIHFVSQLLGNKNTHRVKDINLKRSFEIHYTAFLKGQHFLQFSSVAQSCPTLCDPMDCSTQASLSIANSWSLLKLMPTELVMP